MLLGIFDVKKSFRVRPNRLRLVYRKVRGARAFGKFSAVDSILLRYIFYSHGQDLNPGGLPVDRRREAVMLMLLLEGYGRDADLRRVRDFRQDEVKIYTAVNVLWLTPLTIVVGLLVVGAIAAKLRQPKHSMVFQVPVSFGQLMSCARAREADVGATAFGHPAAKLQMGIVTVYEDDAERQKFSINASETVPYNTEAGWATRTASLDKLQSEEDRDDTSSGL